MQIKTITYQAVKNLGNYESERLEMTVELEGEDPDEAALALRRRVNSLLDSPLIPPAKPEDPPDDFPY